MKSLIILFLILSFSSAGFARNQCELLFQEKFWGQKFYQEYQPTKEPVTVGIEIEAMVPAKIGLWGIVKVLEAEIKKTYGAVEIQHRPEGTVEYRLIYSKNGQRYTFQIHHGWYFAKKEFIDAEVSSPIIRDKEDLEFFLKTVHLLKKKVNFTPQPSYAGVHVHYGFPKTSAAEIGFLLTLFSSLESQILGHYSTTNVRKQSYVKSTSHDVLYYLENTSANQLSLQTLQSILSRKKNYALNILSLQKYETIEMRIFNSSVNHSHILQMVNFTMEFMNAVRTKDSRLKEYLIKNKNSESLDFNELAIALNLPILSPREKMTLWALKYQAIKAQIEEGFSQRRGARGD